MKIWGRSLKNSIFVISILVVALLELTTVCYGDSRGKLYSVYEMLFMKDYNPFFINEGISFLYLWNCSLGAYAVMFMPMIVAFPFVNMFCADKSSGYNMFIVARIGKKKYYFLQMTEAWVCSGLVALLGTWVYYVFLYAVFKGIGAGGSLRDSVLFHIKNSLAVFLYGATVGTPALLFSSVLKNRYIICCVPFMLVYFYDLLVDDIPGFSTSSILYFWTAENPSAVLMGHIAAGILLSCLFFAFMRRKGIYGVS